MTNLEWLAKMPKEEASKFLREFCPLKFPNNTCKDCIYNNDSLEYCYYILK